MAFRRTLVMIVCFVVAIISAIYESLLYFGIINEITPSLSNRYWFWFSLLIIYFVLMPVIRINEKQLLYRKPFRLKMTRLDWGNISSVEYIPSDSKFLLRKILDYRPAIRIRTTNGEIFFIATGDMFEKDSISKRTH